MITKFTYNILKRVDERIEHRCTSENIKLTTIECKSWLEGRKGYKRRRGVYVITDPVRVIYVGKGFFSARNQSHYNKAINKANYNPKGWIYLKETIDYDITNWVLTVVELDSEVDITFLEGALIKDLQPYANDEVHADRK
jgi:hypothetical protein